MEEKNELTVVSIRLVKERSLYSEKPIHNKEDVWELMAKELSTYDREVMCVLNMQANGQVINMNMVSIGTVNQCLVSGRELFKSAILANASNIILVHNHPSGSVQPSKEDILLTRKMEKCGEFLDIPVLDHVIVGALTEEIFSFRSNNMMSFQQPDAGTIHEPGERRETADKKPVSRKNQMKHLGQVRL